MDNNILCKTTSPFLNITLLSYLKSKHTKADGIEIKVHYGQTTYNSIRVCSTTGNWTYVGVTHEYVTSLSPQSTTYVMPNRSDEDVYILHDLSNLYEYTKYCI